MALPYESASSGMKAMAQLEKILSGFDCEAFFYGQDYKEKTLTLQFKHRGRSVQVVASSRGYAAMWLKQNPWSKQRRMSREDYERKALEIAGNAVYSMLRDWVKGQVTAVECGLISFEGAFLAQIMLPNGQTVLEAAQDKGLLMLEGPRD